MTKKEILEMLSTLPKGGITKKTIKKSNGKEYVYLFLQWTENGKQKSRSLKKEEIEIIQKQLDERKKLERILSSGNFVEDSNLDFNTQVTIGSNLVSLVEQVKAYRKRDGYRLLEDYVYGTYRGKVFIMYGLRRTGKTTLMEQIIADMNSEDILQTAFIQVTRDDTFAKLNKDLKLLQSNGFKYIFIDEVTLMSDFIEGAALLSDIYASSGMKIVLSGTDSLGFWITKSNELFDRCILLHTTFIPYHEFAEILGIKGIDTYIRYGGTMCESGRRYNVFENKKSTDEYIDSAIANNIQHSLKYYQYEGHFRHLYDLYEKGELTSAINRVVEDINHRFTIEVLERKFKSNDLELSANNLRKDRFAPTTILDDIDIESFTARLKESLEIKNKEEQSVELDEIHVHQIEEYLTALDLINTIDLVDIDVYRQDRTRIVFTQPGLRYSQAESLVSSLSDDPLFKALPSPEQKRVIERILSEISGRMAEDIILLETKLANPDKKVFKLQFADGEFDMVISDSETLQTQVFEIKYSKELLKEQSRHLRNEQKCADASRRFGDIVKKTVLYRGPNTELDGICYQNIEDYLLSLKKN